MRILSFILIAVVSIGVLVWQSGIVKISTSSSGGTLTKKELKKIGSLGYANWVPVEKSGGKRGLVYHAEGLVYDAPAVFAPANMSKAFMVAINGKNVHSWDPKIPNSRNWQHVHLLPNGDLLAIAKDQYLACITWDSKVKWQLAGRYHHDVSVAKDGSLYALRRDGRYIEHAGKVFAILDDLIDHISQDGKLLSSLSVYDLVADKIYNDLLKQALTASQEKGLLLNDIPNNYNGPRLSEDSKFDILHTNSVLPIGSNVANIAKEGDLLISVRNIDLIGFVAPDTKQLSWSWGQGDLDEQHHPTMTDKNTILIYDNRPGDKKTRVIELDPQLKKIIWKYSALRFYSGRRGAAQRLPNGNTFITESDKGKVFEVDANGKIVWEYYSPHVRKKTGKPDRRSAIYRMIKYPGFVLP